MNKVFQEYNLQSEFNEIFKIYNIDNTSIDFNNQDSVKMATIQSIEGYFQEGNIWSYRTLKVASHLVLYFLDTMTQCKNQRNFIQVLNNKQDTTKILHAHIEKTTELQALHKAILNCTTLLDEKHIINICLKLFQDTIEHISSYLTLFMKLTNVANHIYTKRDYNDTLIHKITKLKNQSRDLDRLLPLINRQLRNNISHANIYYDFTLRMFRDKSGRNICDFNTFNDSIHDAFAFENGLILSYQMLNLIYLNEQDLLRQYIQRIEEYFIVHQQ